MYFIKDSKKNPSQKKQKKRYFWSQNPQIPKKSDNSGK